MTYLVILCIALFVAFVRALVINRRLKVRLDEKTRSELLLSQDLEVAFKFSCEMFAGRDVAIRDADRLAPIVAQYVKDVDETAKLMGDENPPKLTAEREALRLHAEALKLRTNEKTDCQPISAPANAAEERHDSAPATPPARAAD